MTSKTTAGRRAPVGVRVALIAAATTAVGIAAFRGVSAAHTPSVSATCSGLSVDLTQYDGSTDDSNKVTITIDGARQVELFGSSFATTLHWSQTEDHTWSVVVDADLESGATNWDSSAQGTQHACESATTTTQPPETTVPDTTVPETTVPETTVVTTTETPTTQLGADCATGSPAADQVDASCAASAVLIDTPEIAEINAPAVVAMNPTAAEPAATEPAATDPTTTDPTTTNPSVTVPSDSTLPVTGMDTGLQLAIGLAAVGVGTALVVVARRRSRPSTDV